MGNEDGSKNGSWMEIVRRPRNPQYAPKMEIGHLKDGPGSP